MDRRWCARVTSIRTINRHLLNHSMALFLLILWWPRKSKSNQSRPLVMPRVVFLDLSFLLHVAKCQLQCYMYQGRTYSKGILCFLFRNRLLCNLNCNRKLETSAESMELKSPKTTYSQTINQNKIDRQRLKSREAGRQVVRRLRWAVSRGAV